MDRKLRVLLVEDDPVSRAVFMSVLERGGAQVDACNCISTAREAAIGAGHDLWLIDAHLPDGDGINLLVELRGDAPETRAIAHTASRDPALHERLHAAGFSAVLVKPLPAAELVAALALPPAGRNGAGTATTTAHHRGHWDDAQALRALGGQRESLAALRSLFREELPGALERCREAVHRGEAAALYAVLHRLQASAAFVGATALGSCVHALRDAPNAATLAAFEGEVDALLRIGGGRS